VNYSSECGLSADGPVTVNELVIGADIALGSAPTGACQYLERTATGTVSIATLIAAVNAALSGC
jgi:hypothetical protein